MVEKKKKNKKLTKRATEMNFHSKKNVKTLFNLHFLYFHISFLFFFFHSPFSRFLPYLFLQRFSTHFVSVFFFSFFENFFLLTSLENLFLLFWSLHFMWSDHILGFRACILFVPHQSLKTSNFSFLKALKTEKKNNPTFSFNFEHKRAF